jgi:SAM-dependent methyltransferase
VSTPCLICQNTDGNALIKLQELQLGLKETFTYQLCGNCHSLQLLDPPADLTPYYPVDEYYSFSHGIKTLNPPGFLRTAKTKYLLYGENAFLGQVLSLGYKIPDFTQWMKELHAGLNDAILDVGCGDGMLLNRLYRMGFTNLTGIDPYASQEKDLGAVKIFKKPIEELTGKFDVIMMHHVLEHIADPIGALKKAHSLLNENRSLLVRIPVMGNYGWKKYGGFWAGLDAPRHLFIPSEKGMRILAEAAGFELTKIEYDTVDYLIWCSEQYKNGMSLYAPGSHMMDKNNSSFSKEQIKEYKKILAEENAKNNGDTAAYFLKRK